MTLLGFFPTRKVYFGFLHARPVYLASSRLKAPQIEAIKRIRNFVHPQLSGDRATARVPPSRRGRSPGDSSRELRGSACKRAKGAACDRAGCPKESERQRREVQSWLPCVYPPILNSLRRVKALLQLAGEASSGHSCGIGAAYLRASQSSPRWQGVEWVASAGRRPSAEHRRPCCQVAPNSMAVTGAGNALLVPFTQTPPHSKSIEEFPCG
jgi:hypothetical protein